MPKMGRSPAVLAKAEALPALSLPSPRAAVAEQGCRPHTGRGLPVPSLGHVEVLGPWSPSSLVTLLVSEVGAVVVITLSYPSLERI